MNRCLKFNTLLTIALLSSLLATTAKELRWWDVCAPRDGKFGGGHVPEKATEAEAKVIKAKQFPKWQKYEDEFVSFEYPDHELIKLTVNEAKDPIKVEGGVCTSVDNSHTQSYILNVGPATFGVFLLNPSPWLDDGICWCGPMVHHAYKIEKGTLTRFSMLPGGAVKKAQVIGGGLRLMAFEWTHLACSRPVYEHMVASMKIKSHFPEGDEFLRKKLIKHYGDDAKAGLVSRGSSAQNLIETFGKPNEKNPNGLWTWSWIGKEYPCKLKAIIKNDQLDHYLDDGISRDYDKPLRGSIPWCEQLVQELNSRKPNKHADLDAGLGEDPIEPNKEAPIPEKDIQLFRATVTKLFANVPGDSSREWVDALRLASDAADVDIKDDTWVQAVLDKGTGIRWELHFLKATSPDKRPNWALAKLKQHSDTHHESSLDHDDLEGLLNALNEKQLEAWNALATDFWQMEKSPLRYLALMRPDLQDAIQVESRAVTALKMDPESDDSAMVYFAMDAITEIPIQNKTQLLTLVEKLPKGREHGEWHKTRQDAIDHLQPEKE